MHSLHLKHPIGRNGENKIVASLSWRVQDGILQLAGAFPSRTEKNVSREKGNMITQNRVAAGFGQFYVAAVVREQIDVERVLFDFLQPRIKCSYLADKLARQVEAVARLVVKAL